MKKKVNIFGKGVPVLLLVILGMGLVSAALVPYISNSITGTMDVSSPMKIELTHTSCDGDVCTFNVFGGEIIEIEDRVTKLTAEDTGDMLIEIKVDNFDGEGIELDWYYQSADPAIPFVKFVSSDENTYYYLGETLFNWDLKDKDFYEEGLIKVKTALALDPTDTYSFSASVITAGEKVTA